MNTSIGQENNEEIYEKQHIHISMTEIFPYIPELHITTSISQHRAFFHTILDATGAALFSPLSARWLGRHSDAKVHMANGEIRDMIPSGKQTVCC